MSGRLTIDDIREIAQVEDWIPVQGVTSELEKIITDNDWVKYGSVFGNMIWKKDDKWLFVSNDGGSYKVGAEFMVWKYSEEDKGARACWSDNWLLVTLYHELKGEEVPTDPDYQT